jgi:hypothetical protein
VHGLGRSDPGLELRLTLRLRPNYQETNKGLAIQGLSPGLGCLVRV